jgi:hypothetical protein
MSPGQLEFAITQYLDGTLPPEQVDAVRARLETDPAAQAFLAEHEKLTALLRSQPMPELDWSDLSGDLSAVVTGNVDEASRAADQKLNGVLKRAVTPLPELRWEELTKRISAAVDSAVAAGATAENEPLDALLRAAAPMPAVNWDRLATHLSDVVAAQAEVPAAEEKADLPAPATADVVGRIGFVSRFARIAMAASVVLVGGVIAIVASRNGGGTTDNRTTPLEPSKSFVDVGRMEVTDQPAVAEIKIGPSPAYAAAEGELNRRGVASRSPVVIVTPAVPDDDDPEHAPGLFD